MKNWKDVTLFFKDLSGLEKKYLNLKRTNELTTHQVINGSKPIFDKNWVFFFFFLL